MRREPSRCLSFVRDEGKTSSRLRRGAQAASTKGMNRWLGLPSLLTPSARPSRSGASSGFRPTIIWSMASAIPISPTPWPKRGERGRDEPHPPRTDRPHHSGGGIGSRVRLLVSLSAIDSFAIDRFQWAEKGIGHPTRVARVDSSNAIRTGRNAVEREYFLARKREELSASIGAACSEARIIHSDLAKRYGVKAAEAVDEARMDRAHGSCDDARLRFVA